MLSYLVKIPPSNTKTAAAFEEVFTQLHQTLQGKTMRFELLAKGANIGFFFSADAITADIIMGQLYAVFPECEMFLQKQSPISPNQNTAATDVKTLRSWLYPIKTHDTFTGDSLSGVLAVMSKVRPGETMGLQVVCTPVSDSGGSHFRRNWSLKMDGMRHKFRPKYWFKKTKRSVFTDAMKTKIGQRLFDVSLRLIATSDESAARAQARLAALVGTLKNYNTLDLNQLKAGKNTTGKVAYNRFVKGKNEKGMRLDVTELSTLFHLPNEDEVPNIIHVVSRKGEPPVTLPTDKTDPMISFFAETNFHGQKIPFGIHRSDRRRHLYTVGKSGSGKSKLLELLIQNDINAGKGVGVLDPHGDLVDNILQMIPKERIKDVIVFDPADLDFPICFNPIENVQPELKIRVTIGFIEIFKKLFGAGWSPRLEHVLRYTTLALLDTPGTTILSIMKMLTDKNYRQEIVRNIEDNVVKNFWVNEFAGWREKFDNEAITPLLNKVGQFVSTNMIRNIVGQPDNKLDIRDFMDNKKIFLVKVSKGILGEENAALLGAMIVTKVYQAAMSRADTSEEQREDFYFYVDEFQNFATDTFDEILSEARKYRLNLTIAHQFLGQLSDNIRKTVFGNVGSIVSFRVGGEDAEILEKEFSPRFAARDIINLGVRELYTKMSIKGELTEAFSARTLDMHMPPENHAKACIESSRKHFARPKKEVMEILQQWEEGKWQTDVGEDFDEPLI